MLQHLKTIPFHKRHLGVLLSLSVLLVSCQAAVAPQKPLNESGPSLTTADIQQAVDEGTEYLFRMIDPELQGVHKYYYAEEDKFEDRLHTIYTSSTIFTLLELYDAYGEQRLMDQALASGEFILSMQRPEGKHAGAFHYSIFTDTNEKEDRYVVGTTSKTIFTLLELHRRTSEQKYLDAAVKGADWLLTMIRDEGNVKPYVRLRDDKWMSVSKDSTLYNGQVLSALSRMYRVTGEQKYMDGADTLAAYIQQKVVDEGCYVGDDYRDPNPISSSWVIMSLLDYTYASGNQETADMLMNCSRELVTRQFTDPEKPSDFGRWKRGFSTSGNGWMSEVLVEVYDYCRARSLGNCDEFKQAVANVTWWLLQRTYNNENTADLPNPQRAMGGLYWNNSNKYVRTDSVCHGMNAYVNILDDLPEGELLEFE